MNNEARKHSEPSREGSAEPNVRKLQLLRAGSAQFGIFTDEIAAIVDWSEPAPLPHAPGSILGVVNIQGRMLTVLNLTKLLDDQSNSTAKPQHIVALRGDEQLAIAADELGETLDIRDAGQKKNEAMLHTLNHGQARVSVLNVSELFPTAIQGRERRRRRF